MSNVKDDTIGTTVRILGVHGVKNYQAGLEPALAAERLAKWWRDAVCIGLSLPNEGQNHFTLDIAYYAHRLHRETAQAVDDPGLLDPELQELVVAWSRLCGAPGDIAQGRLSAPARAAVDWVADRYGLNQKSVHILAAIFFREVQTYFTDTDRRTAATADVADAIQRTAPQVIIAHSLGSVVTYEALWEHKHPPVELLLTIGSPLAMPDIVFDRLNPYGGTRGRPPNVGKWINLADPGDIIAVPLGGVRSKFKHVAADLTDAISAFSFHQVTKYLRCGATAGILATYLQ